MYIQIKEVLSPHSLLSISSTHEYKMLKIHNESYKQKYLN